MNLNKSNVLPSHLKVTPLTIVNNGQEIVTIYTSDRRGAAKALADIVAAIEKVNNDKR